LFNLRHEAVFSRGQKVATALGVVVLNLIDEGLGMFQPHTQGQAFGFEGDGLLVQLTVHVPGRMTGRQDNGAFQRVAF